MRADSTPANQVARAAAEAGGGAKKTLAGAVQMFRELGSSTVALIAGKSEDAEEDPEYLKVRQSPWRQSLGTARHAFASAYRGDCQACSLAAGMIRRADDVGGDTTC